MSFNTGIRQGWSSLGGCELRQIKKKDSVLTQAHSLAGIVSQGQDVLPTGIFSLPVIYVFFCLMCNFTLFTFVPKCTQRPLLDWSPWLPHFDVLYNSSLTDIHYIYIMIQFVFVYSIMSQ